jgi:hypothetical protein
MARSLPDDLRKPLDRLRALNEAEAALFLDVVTRGRPSLSREVLVDSVAEALPNVTRDDLAMMLESLIGWAAVTTSGESPSALAETVASGLELQKEDEAVFRSRFEALVRAPAIAITGRAVEALRGAPGDAFVRATHALDLRVLPQLPNEQAAAVLIHVLRIEAHRGDGEHRFIALRLDDDDLVKLRGVLDEAISRVPSVEGLAASGGITVIRADADE